jgi:Zn-dependent M28 family amino/carboxypeptidase
MASEKRTGYGVPHDRVRARAQIARWWSIGCVLFVLGTQALASGLTDAIVGQISQARYTAYLSDLQSFPSRYYTTAGNAGATDYIDNTFSSSGLTVYRDPFAFAGGTYYNVVATLTGTTHPENVYIVGAHLDSTSDQPTTHAPGADDNASGVAAVLEMAKVLSGYRFDSTIKFIGFNAEEQGLIGSKAYADEAMAAGEKVLGMLNFDMIAYPGSGSTRSVYLAGDSWLVNMLADNATAYTSLSTEKNYSNLYGSDHYYFHSSYFNGSSSAFAIESLPLNNPNYHKTTDTSAYLDFAYASDMTRMGVATIADLAGVISAVPEPSALMLAFFGGMMVLVVVRVRQRKSEML